MILRDQDEGVAAESVGIGREPLGGETQHARVIGETFGGEQPAVLPGEQLQVGALGGILEHALAQAILGDALPVAARSRLASTVAARPAPGLARLR